MRISLNNIKAIDDFVFERISTGEALLFEANMLLSTDLRNDVQHQQNTYAVVQAYSRRKLKAEIAAVQQKLAIEAQHQSFMQRIIQLFKK